MYPGQFGIGGQTTAAFTQPRELFWGGDRTKIQVITRDTFVSGASRDAGSSPTTALRPGLLMGLITASNMAIQWDPTATDGSQNLFGINQFEALVVDALTGSNIDKNMGLVVSAPVKASELLVLGVAMVGSDYEYLARRLLHQSGVILDDDPMGLLARDTMRVVTKAANYTVLAGDTNTAFQAITGAVTFTLPTIKDGLVYEFLQTTNNDMIINGGASAIVAVNTAAGTSVTFNTSSQKLGARARFRAIRLNGTLKWEYTLLSTGTTGTVA
jgi:hypothetical protein